MEQKAAEMEKSKEQILAERQAKKAVKQQNKQPESAPTPANKDEIKPTKPLVAAPPKVPTAAPSKTKLQSASKEKPVTPVVQVSRETDKDKDKIHAEREAKKLAKQAAKKKVEPLSTARIPPADNKTKSKITIVNSSEVTEKMSKMEITNETAAEALDKTKPVLSKAERRAIQEAQRADKAKALEDKKNLTTTLKKTSEIPAKKSLVSPPSTTTHKATSAPSSKALHKVKLFKHLYSEKCDVNINVNGNLNPAIIRLGLQYQSDSVVGSNARCFAFLNAMKTVSSKFSLLRNIK